MYGDRVNTKQTPYRVNPTLHVAFNMYCVTICYVYRHQIICYIKHVIWMYRSQIKHNYWIIVIFTIQQTLSKQKLLTATYVQIMKTCTKIRLALTKALKLACKNPCLLRPRGALRSAVKTYKAQDNSEQYLRSLAQTSKKGHWHWCLLIA